MVFQELSTGLSPQKRLKSHINKNCPNFIGIRGDSKLIFSLKSQQNKELHLPLFLIRWRKDLFFSVHY